MADMLEDVGIEMDSEDAEYGIRPVAFLKLEGDFVAAFEAYLADEDASQVLLKIPRNLAEKLQHELTEILYAG